jgi:hypothetical protein
MGNEYPFIYSVLKFKGTGNCLIHHQALMMEAASTSETSVSFYQTTQRNIPEDSLHFRRRENLKSQLFSYQIPQKVFIVKSYL